MILCVTPDIDTHNKYIDVDDDENTCICVKFCSAVYCVMLLLCIGADFKGDIRGTDPPQKMEQYTNINVPKVSAHYVHLCIM